MTRPILLLCFTVALTLTLLWPERCSAAIPPPDPRTPAATLRRYQIEPTAAGCLGVLRQWQPDGESRARIARLIGELGSESYTIREAATQQLTALGTAAESQLREAVQSDDLEVVLRARQLLAECRQGHAEDVLMAALEWLRQSPSPQATPLLLNLLPVVPEAFQQADREALWACVGPDDAVRLRQALGDPRPIVALGGNPGPGNSPRRRGRERPGAAAGRQGGSDAVGRREGPARPLAAALDRRARGTARCARPRHSATGCLAAAAGVGDSDRGGAARRIRRCGAGMEDLGGHARRQPSAAAGPEAIVGRSLRHDPAGDVCRGDGGDRPHVSPVAV